MKMVNAFKISKLCKFKFVTFKVTMFCTSLQIPEHVLGPQIYSCLTLQGSSPNPLVLDLSNTALLIGDASDLDPLALTLDSTP